MDLNELADRVEALAGPDREVDAEIFTALKLGARDWMHQSPQAERVWAREYTKSIDAAMTLADDWQYLDFLRFGNGIVECTLEMRGVEVGTITGCGRSEAIALTAAALRTKALGAVHTLTEGN